MKEFELINKIFKEYPKNTSIDQSIGDDAAVITPPAGKKLVICTDTLVQGRHFFGSWAYVKTQAFAIAYKAVMVNLSDLASMGAMPHSLLLALTLPKCLNNAFWLRSFANGIQAACHQYPDDSAPAIELIGGDTTRGKRLTVTITALGFAKTPIYRHGAKPGDALFVTGTVGDGLRALEQLQALGHSPLKQRLYYPVARTHIGQALSNIASSMIDLSDGLAQDLTHVLNASNVGADLYLDALPASDELSKLSTAKRLRYQLTGGDDYELLFTAPKNATERLQQLAQRTNTPITCIGEIVAGNRLKLIYHGTELSNDNPHPFDIYPSLKGWTHF